MKGLVILSGGQDSVTCLYLALKRCDEVEAITFNYGQNHSIEVDCASQICEMENVRHIIIDISFLGTIVESALTSKGDVTKLNKKGLPDSYVPNRNALFITLAHAYAQKVGADRLYTGVCETDYSGYPDCRQEFITSIIGALNLGSESEISIRTPLMYINKAATFKIAAELGVLHKVIKYSHTCYNGIRDVLHEWGYGCGTCPACKLRIKGYTEFTNN